MRSHSIIILLRIYSTQKSIEVCKDGGGFIVDGGIAGIPDEAKPENVKAMVDATFKYGVYRK